ncbi:(2Fe-2S)-binding protein [Variovorax sp. YR752]|uniref:(2Fe-2S)-binding protein n=1 Tax=Variovorax sp. YR752 TaxID=1884383 RepID=UPI003138481C
MIVCLCHRVSDHAIVSEVRAGCASFDELQDTLRVATACGACADCALDTFERGRDSAHASACYAGRAGHDRAIVRMHASVA